MSGFGSRLGSRLGLEMLTLLGMPPVEYVRLAGELGCVEVSTGLSGLPLSMFGLPDVFYPDWSLRDDPALRRLVGAAGQDLIRARFSWEGCARQYVELADRCRLATSETCG